VLPGISANEGLAANEWLFQLVAAIVSLGGVFVAYLFYIKSPQLLASIERSEFAMALHRFWHSGWGFDGLYDALIVRPYVFISRLNKRDFIDSFYTGLARLAEGFHEMFSETQNGVLRNYVAGIVVGAIMILTISLFL
jgi:NADH-quinone oxidoreductase subunit L